MRTSRYAVLAVLVAGCGGDNAPESAAIGSGDWTLEPVSTFGATLDDTVLVNTIGSLVSGPEGLLYIVMRRQASITVLHPNGQLARIIGRRGDGPGEFQSPGIIGWRNDSMWVMDPQLQRLSWFDPNGIFLTSEQRPNRDLMPTLSGGYIGMVGLGVDARDTELQYQSAADRPITPIARLEWTLGGFMIPIGPTGGIVGAHPMKDSPQLARHPGTGELAVVEMPGGSGEVRVSWYSPTGTLSHQRTVALAAPPLSASEWEAFVTEQFSDPGPTILIPDVMSRIAKPDRWPPVTRVLMDNERRVWIRGAANDSSAVTWTIVASGNEPPAAASLPPKLRLLSIHSDTVWAMEPGPDDLDIVTLFLLRR